MSDNKVTLDQLDNSVINAMTSSIGDVNELNTENKTVVGALVEIVGKKEIANAIGEPLAETDKFTEMSSEINGLLSTFKTNMMNAGVVVESGDKFKALIDKIKGLTEGEGNKGIQFAMGEQAVEGLNIYDLDFTPNYIFVEVTGSQTVYAWQSNYLVSNLNTAGFSYTQSGNVLRNTQISITDISNTSFNIYIYDKERVNFGKWYAFGVGEEDTALRDSLASILEEKGVDVTEEDDMASLINKVDREFDSNKQQLEAILSAKNIEIEENASLKDLIDKVTDIKLYSMTHGNIYTLGTAADMTVNDYLSTTWVSTTVATIPSVLELPFTGLTVSFQMYCNFSYNSTVVINLVRNSEIIQLYNGSLAGSPSYPLYSLNVSYNFEPGDNIVLTSPGMNKTGNNSPRHVFSGIKATYNIKGL